MKKRIKQNNTIILTWLCISVFFTALSAFLIFYTRRNTPKLQNRKTYYFGVIIMLVAFFLAYRSIRVYKNPNDKHFSTNGDLKTHGAVFIDLIGVSLLVQFVGVWWENAGWLFLVIPFYFIYYIVKKLLSWLRFA